MLLPNNINNSVNIGCSACECGSQIACIAEKLPLFLQDSLVGLLVNLVISLFLMFAVPTIIIFVISFITKLILKYLLPNKNPLFVRTLSVLVGSLIVLPILIPNFEPNIVPNILHIAASIIPIVIVYLFYTLLDLKAKNIFFSIAIGIISIFLVIAFFVTGFGILYRYL